MPHVTIHALEDDLAGNELALISSLTDVVATIYGEWARDLTVVQLFGLAPARWGVGGRPVATVSPVVTFGIREAAFARPDAKEIVRRLIEGVTDAVTSVFGEEVRAGVTVELVGTPAGRTGVGGVLAS
jgi:phenylpyruvate tautomerase PptA (4-oxalocrotonate tautomerase family)